MKIDGQSKSIVLPKKENFDFSTSLQKQNELGTQNFRGFSFGRKTHPPQATPSLPAVPSAENLPPSGGEFERPSFSKEPTLVSPSHGSTDTTPTTTPPISRNTSSLSLQQYFPSKPSSENRLIVSGDGRNISFTRNPTPKERLEAILGTGTPEEQAARKDNFDSELNSYVEQEGAKHGVPNRIPKNSNKE